MSKVEEASSRSMCALVVSFILLLSLTIGNHRPSNHEFTVTFSPEGADSAENETFPILEVEKVVQPSSIYPIGAPEGFEPTNATVTLRLVGSGQPKNLTGPQDTVFLIDTSGSMCDMPPHSDCDEIRIDAVKEYIDVMEQEDRATIVAFGKDCFDNGFEIPWGAWIMNDWGCGPDEKTLHLTPMDKKGKEKLKDGADTLRWSNGSTNIEKAISVANWELIPGYTKRQTCLDYTTGGFPLPPPGGDSNHTWIQILLTDGQPSHSPRCVEEEVQDAVNAGIKIFTIGLGSEANGTFLRDYISTPTGGNYYFAEQPEDLPAIYAEIGNAVEDRAFRPLPGIELEVVDAVPKDLNPSEFSPTPAEIVDNGSHWLVKWDVNEVLRIGDIWEASYVVSSESPGSWNATVYGAAKVRYTAWDGNQTETIIPSAFLDVTSPPPSPPSDVNAFLSGDSLEHVMLTWNPSEDDGKNWKNVVRYEVYRSDVFHPQGLGYVLRDSVPNGSSVYTDTNAGEGDPSDHFYYVCAVSVNDLYGCNMNQVGKFTRPLPAGPSLASIPLIQSDESLEEVLQTVRYNKAWFYDSSSQEWKWYMKSKTYRRGLWSVNHTMGLWVNVTSDCNLTVAGIVPTQTMIHLYGGWNLLSFASFNASYSVSNMKAEIGVTRVEGFESIPPFHLRILTDAEALQAGYGYWVRVVADTVWCVEVS